MTYLNSKNGKNLEGKGTWRTQKSRLRSVCAARLIKLSLQEFRVKSFPRKVPATFDCRRGFLYILTLRKSLNHAF